jgi:carbon-monoxide dehydrogenase medium subunit
VKPAPFTYHAPTSAADAAGLLSELDDAKVIAGGQSLVPLMALRLATPTHLVDIGRVSGLRGIEALDGVVRIGASATQAAAERHPAIAAGAPLLARALPHIGHFQVRNRGTIGGSIAHADPASELPAVALALDAEVTVVGRVGERTVAAADLFTGTWTTALEPDEVLTAVTFPVWEGRCGFAVDEVARRHGDFAIAGACVAVELDEQAAVRRCAIGLFGLGSTPLRASAAERAVTGVSAPDVDAAEVGRLAVGDLTSVPTDVHGSADFRAEIGAVVAGRAVQRALREALHV